MDCICMFISIKQVIIWLKLLLSTAHSRYQFISQYSVTIRPVRYPTVFLSVNIQSPSVLQDITLYFYLSIFSHHQSCKISHCISICQYSVTICPARYHTVFLSVNIQSPSVLQDITLYFYLSIFSHHRSCKISHCISICQYSVTIGPARYHTVFLSVNIQSRWVLQDITLYFYLSYVFVI